MGESSGGCDRIEEGGNGGARTLDRAMGECQDFHALFQDVLLSHAIMNYESWSAATLNRNRNSSTRETLPLLTFLRYSRLRYSRVRH